MLKHKRVLLSVGVLCISAGLLIYTLLPRQRAPYGPYTDLAEPHKKDIAMQLVSSAENSTLDWRSQYGYIEDIHDGRGYTGGLVGFTSATGDMLELIQRYVALKPDNVLARYIPALTALSGSDSHTGLDPGFTKDWKTAAADPLFRQVQDAERDRVYFNPAVARARADGLRTLGQFMYYDAIVVHGPGKDPGSFGAIRAAAMRIAKTPSQTGRSGDEIGYLRAFLDVRKKVMKSEAAHRDTSRLDSEQAVFLRQGNLGLNPPLRWKTYGDAYAIEK